MTRILVVDDEPAILAAVVPLLRSRGYDVYTATSGQTALDAVDRHHPQLVILDLGLPDMRGVDVCRGIREGRTLPIVVLSARNAEGDKVAALDAGADDYVTKPFGPEELLARLRAALRRAEPGTAQAGTIERGDIRIDIDQRRVTRQSVEIRLTPKEFDLLVFFAQHPDRVLTHRTVLRAIWGPNAVDQPEHLRVLVASLRKKLEPEPARPRYIQTDAWVGYRFVTDVASDTSGPTPGSDAAR